MENRARAQHLVDQVAAEARCRELFTAQVRPVGANETVWIDEFEPGSGWGGYSRWDGTIVLDPAYLRDAGEMDTRLAIRHAVGCALFRCGSTGHPWYSALLHGLAVAGMALSGTPLLPAADVGAPGHPGSAAARRRAVVAGDAFTWEHSTAAERQRSLALIAARGCPGADRRMKALRA
ncbi:hypothetical protein [Gordonia aichiensis]|uniref:Uncharacterized protein n=1 Tax=Gordonia aichiensis NBRC 108223 TaxID=1220583 RepID=L7KJ46_9ACTN|nr:hypothetical protein [Gordonia aichiensis]GAC48501.1 hypothetical protein GOACH_05_03720 [Gordonia aichiensis NBRC 108223]